MLIKRESSSLQCMLGRCALESPIKRMSMAGILYDREEEITYQFVCFTRLKIHPRVDRFTLLLSL